MARALFHERGIKPDSSWNAYMLCMKLHDIRKRRFDLNIPYAVVFSDVLQEKLQSYPWVTNIVSIQPEFNEEVEGQLISVKPELLRSGPYNVSTLERFIICLKTNRSVTEFLGSQVNAISIKKSDFEVKNWSVYHAHLDKKIDGHYSSDPDTDLLFFQVKRRVVHLIDIKKHPRGSGWFDPDLIEIVYRNWPWLLLSIPDAELLNPVPDEDMHELSKRVNVMYTLKNGLVVMPSAMGVASSGDSTEAVMQTNRLFNSLKKIENKIANDEDRIRADHQKKTGNALAEKITFRLDIDNHYFIAVGADGDISHGSVVYRLLPVTDTFYE